METEQEMLKNIMRAGRSETAGNIEASRDMSKIGKLEEKKDNETKLPQDYLKSGKKISDVLELVKNKKLQRNQIKKRIIELLKDGEDLKDFLKSILDVIGYKKNGETKEGMGAASAGGYSQPLFGEDLEKVEAKEGMGSSASGAYSTPSFLAKSKKKKDWRGLSDKFRVMPGAKFVKIKDKCKKFPYCNQGDIKALKLFENETLKKTINKISNDMDLHQDIIKEIIYMELVKRQSN